MLTSQEAARIAAEYHAGSVEEVDTYLRWLVGDYAHARRFERPTYSIRKEWRSLILLRRYLVANAMGMAA